MVGFVCLCGFAWGGCWWWWGCLEVVGVVMVVEGWKNMSSLLKRLKVDGSGNFKVTHDKYNMRGMWVGTNTKSQSRDDVINHMNKSASWPLGSTNNPNPTCPLSLSFSLALSVFLYPSNSSFFFYLCMLSLCPSLLFSLCCRLFLILSHPPYCFCLCPPPRLHTK